MFEITKCDLAGRIGTLHTNHGKKGYAFIKALRESPKPCIV